METDNELRNRLTTLVADGAWYTLMELGDASGDQLDVLAKQLGTHRYTIQEMCLKQDMTAMMFDTFAHEDEPDDIFDEPDILDEPEDACEKKAQMLRRITGRIREE